METSRIFQRFQRGQDHLRLHFKAEESAYASPKSWFADLPRNVWDSADILGNIVQFEYHRKLQTQSPDPRHILLIILCVCVTRQHVQKLKRKRCWHAILTRTITKYRTIDHIAAILIKSSHTAWHLIDPESCRHTSCQHNNKRLSQNKATHRRLKRVIQSQDQWQRVW